MKKIKIIEDTIMLESLFAGSFAIKPLPSETLLYCFDTDITIFDWLYVETEDGDVGYIRSSDKIKEINDSEQCVCDFEIKSKFLCWLTNKEKGFLITCVMAAAQEYFNRLPRYNTKYVPESGIKYEELTTSEIIDLIRKLGSDEDDLNELISYL